MEIQPHQQRTFCDGFTGAVKRHADEGVAESVVDEVARISGRGLDSARGFAAIGLFQPKNSINVGGVLRAAGIYGASMVVCSGSRNKYRRAPTDTMKAFRHLPLLHVDDMHEVIPFDCVPVAVDLVDGARSLVDYVHPERAFYIFGPEDGTLGEAVTDWCRDVVYIPTKRCMNLAATVNVVLYDRLAKS